MKAVSGTYFPLACWAEEACERPLSLLNGEWSELEVWRTVARAKVHDLLAFAPPPCPLEASMDDARECNGLLVERVSYAQPFGPRTEGFVLRPTRATGKLPAVVALHDHGAFKYFGKEKIAAVDDESAILTEFKREYYEGRSWANELARRGYVVFVPDVFLWGSRRIAPESVPDEWGAPVLRHAPGSPECIRAYNEFAVAYESFLAKTLFLAGTTWPGIMAYEDRRAVDYILTRPDVDADRLGCGGLSGGGLRTIFLAGLDARIRCALCVGFMSVVREVIQEKITSHTWMLHVPHLSRFLDLPDVISLHGPAPLLVQYDQEDNLWTPEGQEAADQRLRAIYARMGSPQAYRGSFYPGPHKFDRQMQEDAFDWFDQWLGHGAR